MNSNSKHTYRVAIIGAGRIACGFDSPESSQVLTHAHAFTQNPRTELVALVDIDATRGAKEAKRWNTKYYPDIKKMFAETKPDIVIIATPDATHAETLRSVLQLSPKLIICEKPIASTKEELNAMRDLHSQVPVLVNFSRRFDTTLSALCEEFARGKYGTVLSASAVYTKGALHNGSHMIDLARMLFGEVTAVQPLSRVQDWEGEPTVSAHLSFKRCSRFHLTVGDERAYSIFELDILTEKRRFNFSDHGTKLSTQDVINNPLYKGFRILGAPRVRETDLGNALPNLAQHAVRVLDGKEPPRSTLEDAIETHGACFRLLE